MNGEHGDRFDSGESIPSNWTPAFRSDARGRLAKAERVAGGGVRVPATIAPVAIYTYKRGDGTITREFFPPEEAGRLESLRSLRDAPVTMLHPEGKRMVSPETYQRDSIGHVSGEPSFDGKGVNAGLVVQAADPIRRIDAKEITEVSPGYNVLLDPTPGEWRGQRYDAVQRHRTYNHVAIGPAGWARGGKEASLRIDGVDDVAIEVERFDNNEPAPERRVERNDSAMKTEKIDGIELEIGTAAWAQARAIRDQRLDSERKALDERVKVAETKATEASARADAAEARVKALEAEGSPEKLAARVAARTELLGRVRPVLGADGEVRKDAKDGKLTDPLALKTDLELMRMTLAKRAPDFREDGIPESQREVYVRARFEAELATNKAAAAPTPIQRARADANDGRGAAPTAPTRAPSLLQRFTHGRRA